MDNMSLDCYFLMPYADWLHLHILTLESHSHMQGSCSTLPTEAIQANVTGVALRAFTQDQCLIVTDADVFPIRSGNLWMHNIYIRVASAPLSLSHIPKLYNVFELTGICIFTTPDCHRKSSRGPQPKFP